MEGPDPELATDHLLSRHRRVFASSWGPRTDDVLRTACLTLLHRGPATLADVPRLLTDPGFRHRLTKGLDDDLLQGFWDGYDQLTPSGHAQLVGPALARLRAFLLRSFVRDVVGSTTSSFSFPDVLHLPYPYEELLAEARGYRLALTLAHHNLAQLPRELREAVSANARTKVYFTVSPEDAHVLERHVAPELTAHDLSHLGGFQAAVRLVVGGVEVPACTLVPRRLLDQTPPSRRRPRPLPLTSRRRAASRTLPATLGRTSGDRVQAAHRAS